MPTAASMSYLVLAVQANLQWRDISPEMVEDLKHERYKDNTNDRNAEVSSSMGNSGTVVSLGMALKASIKLPYERVGIFNIYDDTLSTKGFWLLLS